MPKYQLLVGDSENFFATRPNCIVESFSFNFKKDCILHSCVNRYFNNDNSLAFITPLQVVEHTNKKKAKLLRFGAYEKAQHNAYLPKITNPCFTNARIVSNKIASKDTEQSRFMIQPVEHNGKIVFSPFSSEFLSNFKETIELPSERLTCTVSSDNRVALNVGRRAAYATIGTSFNKFIASHGMRKVFSIENFSQTRRNFNPKTALKIKNAAGKALTDPSNWFLYSQDIEVLAVTNRGSKTSTVKFVGLASCMSFQYFYNCNAFGKIYSLLRKISFSPQTYTPFSRYPSHTDNMNWTKKTWNKYSNMESSDIMSNVPEVFFTSIAQNSTIADSTAVGIKFLKVKELLETRKVELQQLSSNLQHEALTLLRLEKRVVAIDNDLTNMNDDLDMSLVTHLVSTRQTVLDEIELQKSKVSKVEETITPLQIKLENLMKSRNALEIKYNLIVSELKTKTKSSVEYEKNLALEGFVVDDLIYKKNKDGLTFSLKDVGFVHEDSTLHKVKMHTTKPIEIVFGNKKGLNKISGPHKIEAYMSSYGTPKMLINPYVPWAASQCTSTKGVRSMTRKYYPHTPLTYLPNNTCPDEFMHKLTESSYGKVDVCLGELAATASIGFRENDPTYVVMAIKSFLQSVNPNDPWGISYLQFPNVNSKLKKISFKSWKKSQKSNAQSLTPTKIYLEENSNRCLFLLSSKPADNARFVANNSIPPRNSYCTADIVKVKDGFMHVKNIKFLSRSVDTHFDFVIDDTSLSPKYYLLKDCYTQRHNGTWFINSNINITKIKY